MIDALLLHALVWLLLPLLHPSADGAAASPPARFAVDLLDPYNINIRLGKHTLTRILILYL